MCAVNRPDAEGLEAFLSALSALKKGVVALDGMCASGKSTLAAYVAQTLGASVFHMDDFFLQPHQRTSERLAEPGGNVARERFLEEVLLPISRGASSVSYRRFDCSVQTLLEPVSVNVAPLVLVEGAYSMHPALRPFYAFGAFLSVEPQLQRTRILQRNGEAGLRRFEERWIPLENRYFDALHVQDACRFHLTARS